ncbi:MAG TPA: hypothetical protein V6D08_16615 [Candidatus Obscuribacterales bacterium]
MKSLGKILIYALGRGFDPMITHGDDCIVSLVPVAGYEQVSRFPFRRWLDGAEGAVLL